MSLASPVKHVALLTGLLVLVPTVAAQPGALDTSFGDDGVVTLTRETDPFGRGPFQGATALVPLDDGRIVVGGFFDGQPAAYRLTASGALDPTFGTGGVAVATVGTGDDVTDGLTDAVVLPDGRTVVSTTRVVDGSNEEGVLVAFTASGALDTSFGDGGRVTVPDVLGLSGLGVDGQGRLVAYGYGTSDDDLPVLVVSRYLATGALDPSYGTDGQYKDGLNGGPITSRVFVYPDGRAIVTGQQFRFNRPLSTRPYLLRLTADGQADADFGDGGVVRSSFGTGAEGFADAGVDGQGRVVAVGFSGGSDRNDGELVVERYTAAGERDLSFGTDGTFRTGLGASEAAAYGVDVLADGSALVVGTAGPEGATRMALLRLDASGAPDVSFGTDGVALLPVDDGAPEVGVAVARDGAGRPLVAGYRQPGAGAFAPRAGVVARLLGGGGGTAAEPGRGSPPGLTLGHAGPHPTRGAARVVLRSDRARTVRVAVYDALGRQVAVLFDGAVGAGDHPLALGAGLAPGTYTVRVHGGGAAAVLRVVRP